MAKHKSNQEYYKYPQGIIGFPRQVLRSEAYKDLAPRARALMFELQDVWRPSEPCVHFSVRRAAQKLNVTANTANKAFFDLVEHGFIECVDEYDWYNGKARVWRLTWLTNNKSEPKNNYMEWRIK